MGLVLQAIRQGEAHGEEITVDDDASSVRPKAVGELVAPVDQVEGGKGFIGRARARGLGQGHGVGIGRVLDLGDG